MSSLHILVFCQETLQGKSHSDASTACDQLLSPHWSVCALRVTHKAMKGRKQYCFGSWKFAGVQKIGRGGLNSFNILPRILSKVLEVSQGLDRDM